MPLELTQHRPTGPRLTPAMPATERARDNRPGLRTDDEGAYLPVERLRQQYLDYLTAKRQEIEEQKEGRRYYHAAQWTADEVRILRARRQPIVTYNRTARKINGIVGLVQRMRQDPKAYPRKPQNEDGAEVANNTIRAVLDANDWKTLEMLCALQAGTEGIGGVELKLVQGDKGDPDIELARVSGENYFYDPRSFKEDFSDKRFDGVAKWVDVEEAAELIPEQAELIRGLIESGSDLTTYSDREVRFISVTEKRVRLVEHWYKHKGEWCWAFYIGANLLDEGQSPFRDQKGRTISRFFMFSAAVDHDGDRYGFVRNLKGPQDEINQRRSKGLHISNSRRLIIEKGAVDDVETARREWVRPDGVLETNPGKTVTPDNTSQDLAAQFQWLEEAKNEMESFVNVGLVNMTPALASNVSGRAINLLQQPGLAELGPFIQAIRGWKLSVYRAIWNSAQQFWTSERWLRVTGDENVAQFLQINGMSLDEWGRPTLVNALGALDLDIILDEGPDVVSMEQDAYDVLRNQPPGAIPIQALIELMPIPHSKKQKLLQAMQPAPVQADPIAEQAKQLMLAGEAAKVAKTQAETRRTTAQVETEEAKAVETRSRVATNAARAGHLAMASHLDAAEFTYQALKDAATPTEPQQSAPQGYP